MEGANLLLAAAPLIVLSLALTVFCLVDLIRRPSNAVLGGNKWLWGAVIVFIGTVGPIVYLFLGRTEPPIQEER